jgi:hypothetical protein
MQLNSEFLSDDFRHLARADINQRLFCRRCFSDGAFRDRQRPN